MLEVKGIGGHGSRPHLAKNPVGKVMQILTELGSLQESWRKVVSDPEFGRLGSRERVGALLRGAVAAVAEDSVALRLRLAVAETDAIRAREAVAEFVSRKSLGPVGADSGIARRYPRGAAASDQQGTQIFK